ANLARVSASGYNSSLFGRERSDDFLEARIAAKRDYRDRETDYEQEHDESHCPIRNFEKWKDLRYDLNQQPADDRIGDGDLVNIAPLQFVEEALHGPMHSKSFAPFGRQKFPQPAKRQYSGSPIALRNSRNRG